MLEEMNTSLINEEEDRESHYRWIFDQLDTDRDGLIHLKQLRAFDESQRHLLPKNRIDDVIHALDDNKDVTFNFDQFFKLVDYFNNRENQSLSSVLRYIGTLISRTSTNLNTSTNPADEPNRSIFLCIVMIGLSVCQIAFFLADRVPYTNWNIIENGSISMLFIFEHTKRYQIWRFFTYMLIHVGYMDLFVNLCVQLLLGTYLQKVHGWCKTSILYFAGVLSGSMLSSSTDIWTRLAGVSGGVYALLTAHLINIFMERRVHITREYVKTLIIGSLIGCELGISIYTRHFLSVDVRYSYMARIGGIATGATLGMLLFKKEKPSNTVLWICIISHLFLTMAAVYINV
ncbi:rhomboid-related protein 2-like [Euwallacea similis]|uniref:rhomboid-related protein 2-like n=1 Tax=Euwallacea similis TaxID=1736056 RepID=UPI00344FBEE8